MIWPFGTEAYYVDKENQNVGIDDWVVIAGDVAVAGVEGVVAVGLIDNAAAAVVGDGVVAADNEHHVADDVEAACVVAACEEVAVVVGDVSADQSHPLFLEAMAAAQSEAPYEEVEELNLVGHYQDVVKDILVEDGYTLNHFADSGRIGHSQTAVAHCNTARNYMVDTCCSCCYCNNSCYLNCNY